MKNAVRLKWLFQVQPSFYSFFDWIQFYFSSPFFYSTQYKSTKMLNPTLGSIWAEAQNNYSCTIPVAA